MDSKELTRNADFKSEIFTGDEYCSNPVIQSFVSIGSNITLTFNTDGM